MKLSTTDLLTICELVLETSTTTETIETCYKQFADNWYDHFTKFQLPTKFYYDGVIPTLQQALANNITFWQTCNVQ